MYCTSIFTCIITVISHCPIIYDFRELFWDFYFTNITYFGSLCLDVILILSFLMVTFFSLQNQLYFMRVPLKKYKTFSYNIFHDINYVCLLCDQIPKFLINNIHKEIVLQFLVLKNFLDYLHIHLFLSN